MIAAQATTCPQCARPLQEVLLKAAPEAEPEPPLAAAIRVAVPWRRATVVSLLGLGVACYLAVAHRAETGRDVDYVVSNAPVLPYRTTAADLYANYTAYEAATRQEPPRVGVELSGTITSIDRTMFAEPEIHLEAGADAQIVAVTLEGRQENDAHRLVTGQSVTVRCDNMSRVLAQPTGQNCRLID